VRRLRPLLPALAGLLLLAAPAQAHHSARRHRVHHHARIAGVVPTHRIARQRRLRARAAAVSHTLDYHGGGVMHSSVTYNIYWLPSGEQYGATASDSTAFEAGLDGFLTDVGSDSGQRTNVYASDAQYTDSSGRATYDSHFAGSIVDTQPFPASGCSDPGYSPCLTDGQVIAEVDRVVAAQGWTRGPTHLFVLYTPQGVGSCFAANSGAADCAYSGYCAYHSGFGTQGAGETLYANIAYADDPNCSSGESPSGSAAIDSAANLVSHEHNEAITDPWGDGWWETSTGEEDGDLCAWDFYGAAGTAGAQYDQTIAGHHYFLQPEWSNADPSAHSGGCVLGEGPPPTASFTASPATALTQTSVSFSAAAQPAGTARMSKWSWSFGDGSSGLGSSTTHSYATPGTRTATLTETDAFGGTGTATQTIVSDDQPPVAAPAVPTSGVAGTPLDFGPGTSHDPDGSIASYSWDFGDGASSGQATVQHTYAAAGTYTVSFTVTDDSGSSTSAVASVTISTASTSSGTQAAPAQTPSAVAASPGASVDTGTGAAIPTAVVTASASAPRLTLRRIATVRLRQGGNGTVVLRVSASGAGTVVVRFRGSRRSFRLRKGTNTLRIGVRHAQPGRRTLSLIPVGTSGTRGPALARHVTLRRR
jgi:PKD repeat protein